MFRAGVVSGAIRRGRQVCGQRRLLGGGHGHGNILTLVPVRASDTYELTIAYLQVGVVAAIVVSNTIDEYPFLFQVLHCHPSVYLT
jgi:hypothetical protein